MTEIRSFIAPRRPARGDGENALSELLSSGMEEEMIFDQGWAVEGGRLEVVNDPVIPGPAVLRAERHGGASRAELRLPPPQSHPGGIPGVSRYVTRYYLPRAPENRVCIAQWHDSWDVPPAFKKHCDPATYQRWYGRGLFAKVHPPVAIVVRGELLTLELGTIGGVPLLTEDPAACGTRYLSLNRPENTRLDVHELCPAPIRAWFELKTEIHASRDSGWIAVSIDGRNVAHARHSTIYNSRGNIFKIGSYGDGVVYMKGIQLY